MNEPDTIPDRPAAAWGMTTPIPERYLTEERRPDIRGRDVIRRGTNFLQSLGMPLSNFPRSVLEKFFPGSGRRVLVVDPSLKQRAGHPYHAARAVAEKAASAGLAVTIFGALRAPSTGSRIRRCFSRSLYARTDWSAAGYVAESSLLAAELTAALDRRDRSAMALILPTCEQTQLRAVADLVAQGVLPKSIDILGWLLFPPLWNSTSPTHTNEPRDEYRDALQRLDAATDSNAAIWLCCETNALLARYDGLPGVALKRANAPSTAADGTPFADSEQRRPPHVVVAGHATRAKGYDLLPDALRTVLASHASMTFTIHGVGEGSGNSQADAILNSLEQYGPRVKVLRRDLDSKSYYALIASADLLLLPYRLPEYQDRGSGIFNETLRYGIPVVAPAGCAFAKDAIRDRRAIALHEHTPAALAEAILDAAHALDELRENCGAFLAGQRDRAPDSVLHDFFRRVWERPAP